MTDRARTFARWLLWALPLWALLLLLATLTHQPDPQTEFEAWSNYVTTDVFLASHLVGSILGAGIGSVGFAGLMLFLSDSRAVGRATAGMVAMVVGNTLMTGVFGVAAFTQPALGRSFLSGNSGALALYNDVNSLPLFVTAAASLLLFMIGGVLAGLAIAGSGRLPRWAGWLMAVSMVLFAPSFLLLPLAQTPTSLALLVATLAVAWVGSRQTEHQPAVAHTVSA